MLRWIVLLVLVVGLSAAVPLLLSNLPADSTSGPAGLTPAASKRTGPPGQVYVEGSLVHEFGTMAQWTEGEKEWTVKNVGEGELELAMGPSSCMCTVANFARDEQTGEEPSTLVLEPGKSTKIKVTWKTKDSIGEFVKTTGLVTSDPKRPQISFQISGKVQPALVTMPAVGDFGNFGAVPNSSPQSAAMLIASIDQPDFQILEVVSSNPKSVGVSFREANEDEIKGSPYTRAYRLDVEVKPLTELGSFREEVIVRTDHPQRPELKLTLQGSRVGPIILSEPSLRIFDANSKTGGTKSVILTVQGQDSTQFEVAEKPEKLEVKIAPVDPHAEGGKVRRYTLTASIPPGTPAGTISGQIVLKIDHPEVSQLKIPVSAAVLSEGF